MKLTAEVRPSAFEARPFKVVFRRADQVLAEWPVATLKAGEERIAETLGAMACATASKGSPCHLS
jgi:hypothetical protein